MGVDGFGMGLMLEAGMIASHTGSYVGENRLLEQQVLAGQLDLTLLPQGTLAERIRAGGAGIPAFYVPAGVGTVVAEGKETRTFDGREYLLEARPSRRLRPHQSLARRPPRQPHLSQDRTQLQPAHGHRRQASPSPKSKSSWSQANSTPTHIDTPGIYVNRILLGTGYIKPIESEFLQRSAPAKGAAKA